MFGELPKLFDRDFAIGYFLPVAAFVSASLYLFNEFDPSNRLITKLQGDLAIGTTTIGLISWLGGILLMTVNREVYMFFEGYGKFNPIRVLMGNVIKRQIIRYNYINSQLSMLNKPYSNLSHKERERKALLAAEKAERFPDEEIWVLPTGFGNIIRAFEVYPRVMYGLESIEGWDRILAVVPKDYRALIDSAKAQTDFWINIVFLGNIFICEYVMFIILYHFGINLFFILPVTIALNAFAYWRAKNAAIEWGELIKSAFDVFLPKLRDFLAFDVSSSIQEERGLWEKFSQAIIYRVPNAMPNRARRKPEPESQDSTFSEMSLGKGGHSGMARS